MNKQEAQKILEENKLHLKMAGIDNLPVKTVEIETFEVTKGEPGRMVTLLGNLRDKEEYRSLDADFRCVSFFIKDNLIFWYRDSFDEAMEVINALRVTNDYNEK